MNFDPSTLLSVKTEIQKYAHIFQTANYEMKVRGISQYPIFILSKEKVNRFSYLIENKNDERQQWHIYISYLEELINRKILESKKALGLKERFRKIDADEDICILILDQKFINIVFLPCPQSTL